MRLAILTRRPVVIWSLLSLGLLTCLMPYLLGWKQMQLTWRDVQSRQLQPLGGAELPKAFVAKRRIPQGTVLDADMVECTEISGHDLANMQRAACGKQVKRVEDIVGRIMLLEAQPGMALLEGDFGMAFADDTPVRDVLPPMPTPKVETASAWNVDLAKVPEVGLTAPLPNLQDAKREAAALRDQIRRIQHLNRNKVDGFMAHLAAQRDDLRGLPFQMGEACKMDTQVSAHFENAVASVHRVRSGLIAKIRFDEGVEPDAAPYSKAKVAALVQIFGPESEAHHLAEVKELAGVHLPEATHALAKLALFAPESAVRSKTLEALKTRDDKDVTPILWEGLHYPLPTVAQRAAVAIGTLKREDMIPKLLDFLESDDPRAPAEREIDGKRQTAVRELVRINHHRNCLLCHAPGDGDEATPVNPAFDRPAGPLQVAIPLPSEPLPQPSPFGGYESHNIISFPDLTVRTDITYLRQDFSMFMPVENASPWPRMQRFDFLVRTRAVTTEEAEAIREGLRRENGRRTPYQEAALDALRRLTKQDTAPNADAWRKLLKMPKAG